MSQEHLQQRRAVTANVYENDDWLSCEENESHSMRLMPAIKPVLVGRAMLTCHGGNRGRQWTRCFNSPHTLPVGYYEAGVRESYVWSNETKPNQQANKDCSLAHFLDLFLKNSVFWEDKECHFPHIIPLSPRLWETLFKPLLHFLNSDLWYAMLCFTER